jgi:RNA polymerase sigma-70 factor (ECF subfamily)
MNTEDFEDADLMKRLSNGEMAAFSLLMKKWERALTSFAYRYLHNLNEAREVVVEVFTSIYQNAGRFDPNYRFSTWAFSMTANRCRNRLRWHRRHPAENIDDTTHELIPVFDAPDGNLEKKERIECLKQAIGELPHALKTTFLLFEYEGLSYEAIAQIEGCQPRAVETRLYRARKKLQDIIANSFHRKPESSPAPKQIQCGMNILIG